MIQMLLVDDEPTTRAGVRKLVDWQALNVEIVGEASDGEEALKLVDKNTPDIVLCDIRMPRMDGIALVGSLRERYPNLQIIFMSGYSDTVYLKSAIRFGAVDYLDKPVRKDELISVVKRAIARIYTVDNPLVNARECAAAILSGRPVNNIEMCFPFSLSEPYRTVILEFDSYGLSCDGVLSGAAEASDALLILQREEVAYRRYIRRLLGRACFFYIYHQLYVLHLSDCDAGLLERSMRDIQRFKPAYARHMSITVSSSFSGVDHLRASYQQARGCALSFFQGFGRIYFCETGHKSGEFRIRQDDADAFIEALSQQRVSGADIALRRFTAGLEQGGMENIPEVYALMSQLAMRVTQLDSSNGGNYPFQQIAKIYHFQSLPQIKAFLQSQVDALMTRMSNLSSKGRTVYEVEKFIRDHLHEDLSVPEIAQKVYVTPSYLCFLYKQVTGKTIMEFVTEVKMEKAKELLRDPALKLQQAAQMLGYANAANFTRIFTKHFGISPTKYRNQVLQEAE